MSQGSSSRLSRRDFVKSSGSAALAAAAGLGLPTSPTAFAQDGSRFNILMIVTDQEQYFRPGDLPDGFRLPGQEKLASTGRRMFENHQVASCVCTPSRAVMYTGQHIQNNGMFDNTNFPGRTICRRISPPSATCCATWATTRPTRANGTSPTSSKRPISCMQPTRAPQCGNGRIRLFRLLRYRRHDRPYPRRLSSMTA